MKKLLASTLVLGLFAFDNTLSFAANDEDKGCWGKCWSGTRKVVKEVNETLVPLAQVAANLASVTLKAAGKPEEAKLVGQLTNTVQQVTGALATMTASDKPDVQATLTGLVHAYTAAMQHPELSVAAKVAKGAEIMQDILVVANSSAGSANPALINAALKNMKEAAKATAGYQKKSVREAIAMGHRPAAGANLPQLQPFGQQGQWPVSSTAAVPAANLHGGAQA